MDKGHRSSSELSDINLDEDDDDIGEIEPDHYFDGGKIPVFKPVSPLALRLVALTAVHVARAHGPINAYLRTSANVLDVHQQTMDQFRSFKKFTDKIDKYGMKSGIVKVIPPQEWSVKPQPTPINHHQQ